MFVCFITSNCKLARALWQYYNYYVCIVKFFELFLRLPNYVSDISLHVPWLVLLIIIQTLFCCPYSGWDKKKLWKKSGNFLYYLQGVAREFNHALDKLGMLLSRLRNLSHMRNIYQIPEIIIVHEVLRLKL